MPASLGKWGIGLGGSAARVGVGLPSQSATSDKLTLRVALFLSGHRHGLEQRNGRPEIPIWLLLVQQPHLISCLRSKHKNAGASIFRGDSAFIALSTAFESVLKKGSSVRLWNGGIARSVGVQPGSGFVAPDTTQAIAC